MAAVEYYRCRRGEFRHYSYTQHSEAPMITSIITLLYFFILLGLSAGVVWMLGRTLLILLGRDTSGSNPSRRFEGPITG
jgi:hypothetical protein